MGDGKNLELWSRVCTTDPEHVKDVKIGIKNPRKFTAINAQHQRFLATREWGKYGQAWGVRDLKWGLIDTHDGQGMTLEATFFYPDGFYELSVDMPYHPGSDCRKKLLTDLTTKALSFLGFNADVFMDKFKKGRAEDNKYMNPQQVEPSSSEDSDKYVSAVEANALKVMEIDGHLKIKTALLREFGFDHYIRCPKERYADVYNYMRFCIISKEHGWKKDDVKNLLQDFHLQPGTLGTAPNELWVALKKGPEDYEKERE